MKRLKVVIKTTSLVLFLMLIIGIRLFANPVESGYWKQSEAKIASESENTSEIQNSLSYYLQSIEVTNHTLTFTEVHRLLAVSILSNRIAPARYIFRRVIYSAPLVKHSSSVPIFIKGHALLN